MGFRELIGTGARWLVLLPLAVFLPVDDARATAREDGRADRRVVVAERAVERQDWAVAAAAYVRAARSSRDASVAERATRVAFATGQWNPTVAAARRWLELAPDAESAHRLLGMALLRLHRPAESAEQFRWVLQKAYPDRAEGFRAFAASFVAEQDESAAAEVMDALARLEPGLAEAQYAASVLWERADHGERALSAARRALELRSGWRDAEVARLRALATLSRYDEAIAGAVTLGADGESRLVQVWFLLRARRRDEARALLDALVNDRSVAAAAGEALAVLDLESGRQDEARTRLEALLKEGRDAEAAAWHLADLATKRGDREGALALLSRITTGPRAGAALLRRVRLHEELGRGVEAEVALDDYLNANPSDTVDIGVGRASQLLEQKRGDAGLALLQRLRAVYPDADAVDGALATLQERMDHVDDAVRTLRDLLARRPDDPTAQNALGYVLADRTGKVAEGLRLIELAIAAKPDSGPVVDSLGWALVRSGRAADGLPHLERAWQLTEDAEVASHLGTALWLLGRRDEAHALWNRVLKEHPDNRHLLAAIAAHPQP